MRAAVVAPVLAVFGAAVPTVPAAVVVRAPVEDDKVWRSALRFSLAPLATHATILSAQLELYFDRVCVAPRRTAGPCPAAPLMIAAHRIWSEDWYHEREVDFDPAVEDETVVSRQGASGWPSWDVTELARAWLTEEVPHSGILLKLADRQEDFGASGPYFPSMSFANAAARPRLVISYAVAGTAA